MVAFNHCFQNCSLFPPSVTSLPTRVWNWSQYITYVNATPFVWNQMKLVLSSIVACSVRFRTFDSVRLFILSVRFPNVRLCSTGKNFGVSSITEPNRTSIERLEFDWVWLPNVQLTKPRNFHHPIEPRGTWKMLIKMLKCLIWHQNHVWSQIKTRKIFIWVSLGIKFHACDPNTSHLLAVALVNN